MKNLVLVFFTFFIFLSTSRQASAAQALSAHPVRVGLSLGTAFGSGACVSADAGRTISDNISLGGEFCGLHLISLRGLIWEKPASMAGFFGGPKLYIGLDRDSSAVFAAAGDFGWMHRFDSKVDLGLAADVVIENSLRATLKIMIGYLF